MDTINQLDIEESRETLESKLRYLNIVLFEMSQILNCGLSRETLSILITMIEKGANPEALVQVVKEMRNQSINGPSNQMNTSTFSIQK